MIIIYTCRMVMCAHGSNCMGPSPAGLGRKPMGISAGGASPAARRRSNYPTGVYTRQSRLPGTGGHGPFPEKTRLNAKKRAADNPVNSNLII